MSNQIIIERKIKGLGNLRKKIVFAGRRAFSESISSLKLLLIDEMRMQRRKFATGATVVDIVSNSIKYREVDTSDEISFEMKFSLGFAGEVASKLDKGMNPFAANNSGIAKWIKAKNIRFYQHRTRKKKSRLHRLSLKETVFLVSRSIAKKGIDPSTKVFEGVTTYPTRTPKGITGYVANYKHFDDGVEDAVWHKAHNIFYKHFALIDKAITGGIDG